MADHTVRIGTREIAVEQSPLQVNYLFCGVHDKFALSQPADGQLRLLSRRSDRVLGWIFFVPGLPVLILGLLSIIGLLIRPTLENVFGTLFLLGLGFLFVFLGVKLLGRRYRFDSGAGELTIRHFGRTLRRPLADIVAVQVINAGLFGSNNSDGDERFISYQLNLILDDPSEPRLFVAYNRDVADMGKKAKLLADFLHVPLLTATQIAGKTQEKSRQDSAPPTGERSDPTRHWPKKDEAMPPFDLEAGALGGLCLDEGLEQAEFLGRPDRVEHLEHPGWMTLHYLGRGFKLGFLPQFVELTCCIAPPSDVPPERGQGFSRPRLSGGIELTTETSVAQVRELFGPPKSEWDSPRDKTLTLIYFRGRFYMEFEFEQSTGRLLTWSVPV